VAAGAAAIDRDGIDAKCGTLAKSVTLGRSIHIRGKGCARDTTISTKISVFPLSAWADAGA
jgi:hypothetical protein